MIGGILQLVRQKCLIRHQLLQMPIIGLGVKMDLHLYSPSQTPKLLSMALND